MVSKLVVSPSAGKTMILIILYNTSLFVKVSLRRLCDNGILYRRSSFKDSKQLTAKVMRNLTLLIRPPLFALLFASE